MTYGIILKKPLRFRDIPQFTRMASYAVDISWDYLLQYLDHDELNLDPDFQRGHVWTPEKQVSYVEFCLRGGVSANNVYLNCPKWNMGGRENYVLVDGKQRITAVLAFLNNEVPVFGGHCFRDFEGKLPITGPSFHWCVNDLDTRAEVLQWYLELNTGGVVHTTEEIQRVQALLAKEQGQ